MNRSIVILSFVATIILLVVFGIWHASSRPVEVLSVEIFSNPEQVRKIVSTKVVGKTRKGFDPEKWEQIPVTVSYLDVAGETIHTEDYDNINSFFGNNKNQSTYILNHGQSTKITYKKGNDESIRTTVVNKAVSEHEFAGIQKVIDLSNKVADLNRENNQISWDGVPKETVNVFEIFYEYDDGHNQYIGDIEGVPQFAWWSDMKIVTFRYKVTGNTVEFIEKVEMRK